MLSWKVQNTHENTPEVHEQFQKSVQRLDVKIMKD